MADRRGVGAAGDQAGHVGDVSNEDRLDLARYIRERLELDRARDRGPAAEDQLRPLAQSQLTNLVEVRPAGVLAHPVLDRAEPPAGHRHAPAVGEVAAHRQRHPHHRVAGLAEGEVDGEVGWRSRVRLDVYVLDPEHVLRALDCERLEPIDDLLALVVAAAGVALRVLVGEHAPHRLEHGTRDVVLRGD